MQRKEASNQKMQEKKSVLELKNTKKKVWANMWNELFSFYPLFQCALMDMVNMDMVDTDMVETDKMDTDNVRGTWTPVKLVHYWVRHAKYTWSSL